MCWVSLTCLSSDLPFLKLTDSVWRAHPICAPGHSQSLGGLLTPWATACTPTSMFPFPSISLWSHAGFCCIYSCITALSFGELIALIFVFLFYFISFHGIRLGCQFNLHVNVFLLNTPYYHFFSYSFLLFSWASSWFLEECTFFLTESFIGSLCSKESRDCVWC